MEKIVTGKIIIILVLVLALLGNVFQAFIYIRNKDSRVQSDLREQAKQMNDKTLTFLKLFIEKVLQSDGEVKFEDRLKLENAVRELKDAQILTQWQLFVDSKNNQEAQKNLRLLLVVIINKLTS